ncbi:thermoresistant gluconokinase [Nemania sp. FL0916]|nr:thermoresistant gluconokinase [Nemania sp. FL0916]
MLTYNTPVLTTGEPASVNSMSSTLDPLGLHTQSISAENTPAMSGNIVPDAAGQPVREVHHIWLVTGPAGCGKTTVAEYLSHSLNLPYLEGDKYHPAANIDKMSKGIPLTDADRWDWLTLLREESLKQLASGAKGVILTCSALKRKYRDVIRVAPYFSHDVLLHFIYLHAPEAVLLDRVGLRQGHYMGANMVRSQFEILEPPTADETDVISVDVSGPIAGVLQVALEQATNEMSAAAV